MKKRIYIVDDQKVFIDGLIHLFRNDNDIEIVGYCTSPKGFLQNLNVLDFDILLLDYKMSEMNGVEVIKKLSHEIDYMRIIMISVYHDIKILQDVIGAGAKGYLTKNSSIKDFKTAFAKVMNGDSYFNIN